MSLVIILLQGDDFVAIDNALKKRIQAATDKVAFHDDDLSSYRINKADYDKTLIGFVSEKIVPEKPKDDNDYKWRIQTNGVAYDIKPSACNITSVGQRVRLYVPNHSLKDKYAEVIDNIFDNKNLIEVTKVSNNEVYAIYKSPVNPNILYKQTIKAEGSGNERYNFTITIKEVIS